MTMHRFFVDPAAMAADRFALPQSIAHQVTRVLRLHSGEQLVLLDGAGMAFTCRLDGGDCVVESRERAGGEPVHRLIVWQALLRGDHTEEVVRHGTELGVAEFRLFTSERCVAREPSTARLDRLRTVAREAAEQSERGIIPPVSAPVRFREVLAAGGSTILLDSRAEVPGLAGMAAPDGVVIGPEGGFTPDEVADAERAGLLIASLGQRILRSETVAVAAAAVILSRTGDFA
jgi:16S rRNA (uracil1498-N3)-methyltransferase